jgi:hypothetical protein
MDTMSIHDGHEGVPCEELRQYDTTTLTTGYIETEGSGSAKVFL